MSKLIIGISGKIGSGKDTLADFLQKWSNKPILAKKSFAYKLKMTGAFLTGTDSSLWFTQEGKNVYLDAWGMTIGEFQQKLGTEAIRNGLHSNAWIISLFADLNKDSRWVITDMRFKNEAKAVKDNGGILVRIDGDPTNTRTNSKRDLTHPSETDLDDFQDWDVHYKNTGTLADLEVVAQLILAKWDQ